MSVLVPIDLPWFPCHDDKHAAALEISAKIAYTTWAHRTGRSTPFEHLPVLEMMAWREVVTTLDDLARDEPPECVTCGNGLTCLKCQGAECPNCGEGLTCAACEEEDASAEQERES